jgi:hypothetical protein
VGAFCFLVVSSNLVHLLQRERSIMFQTTNTSSPSSSLASADFDGFEAHGLVITPLTKAHYNVWAVEVGVKVSDVEAFHQTTGWAPEYVRGQLGGDTYEPAVLILASYLRTLDSIKSMERVSSERERPAIPH